MTGSPLDPAVHLFTHLAIAIAIGGTAGDARDRPQSRAPCAGRPGVPRRGERLRASCRARACRALIWGEVCQAGSGERAGWRVAWAVVRGAGDGRSGEGASG
jgi:hypothetical protein